jgi:hypothetical protein
MYKFNVIEYKWRLYKAGKLRITLRRARSEKAVIITYFELVSVALVIQHAKRIRLSLLYSVACFVSTIFFHVFS